jgi:hypothetical protein
MDEFKPWQLPPPPPPELSLRVSELRLAFDTRDERHEIVVQLAKDVASAEYRMHESLSMHPVAHAKGQLAALTTVLKDLSGIPGEEIAAVVRRLSSERDDLARRLKPFTR